VSDLTILTVAENTGELLDLMLTSVFKYTSPDPKVIVCNNGKTDKYIKKWSEDDRVRIINNKPNMSGGSNRHGEGLQKIFGLVDTPRVAILDSDTVLLSDKWCEFNTIKYDLVGLERGTESGKAKKSYYYHMCFMIMNTEKFKQVDFRPGKKGTRKNGRSYSSSEDVGWMVRNFVVPQKVKLLKFVNLKNNKGVVFDNSFCSVEIHSDGTVIAAHFGRGSNLGGKIDRKGFDPTTKQLKRWIEIAREYMK
jgi:hypothetical protein